MVLTAHGLGVGVRGKRLLTGIDFDVDPGGIMAVIGPSGAGKTTLLRTIVGLIDPLEGEVKLEGKGAGDIGWARFRRLVMLVAQRPVLFEGTVADNLRRPFSFGAADGAFDEGEAEELLGSVGLEDVLEQEARTLSEGQAQRMALVRALLLHPRVLVLDEPTSALDGGSRDQVEALLAARELTVVMVSHDPKQVERLAGVTLDLEPFMESG